MLVPKYIYRLSSQSGHLSCFHKDRSYSVGFVFKEHPIHIKRFTCEGARVQVVDPWGRRDACVLKIEKKININKLPLRVSYTTFEEFITTPFATNAGCAIVYDVISDDADAFSFDVQLLDGEFIPELFAKKLNTQI